MQSSARASSAPDGTLEIASATAEIGPGTYTMLTQIGAEMLGLPLDKVKVQDRRFGLAGGACRRRIVDHSVCRFGGDGGV